ncbi:hypothetical protein Ciccas_008063 [Cichlidogyrus casuarinus]|uniref:PDZ domain-containing protein n=1 Tax=Cichlidogyrus casuarinus TaxID=1844966 RepID=A0ABD2Q125_9PLAT
MVVDPHYGVFYIDHVNKRTQYEPPAPNMVAALVKEQPGFGFTVVGESLPQVQTLLSEGVAALEGTMCVGDVIVAVDGQPTLGMSHEEFVTLVQEIPVGKRVSFELNRCESRSPSVIAPAPLSLPAKMIKVSPLITAPNH